VVFLVVAGAGVAVPGVAGGELPLLDRGRVLELGRMVPVRPVTQMVEEIVAGLRVARGSKQANRAPA